MIRKLGWVAVAVVGTVVVLNNTKLGSYASTAWSKVRTSASKQVPVEFEIDRIRNQIAQLMPDMKKNVGVIAEEMVAIENLKKNIADTQAKLEERKQGILTMTDGLEKGATFVSLSGKPCSRDKAEEQLTKELASYKRCETELESRKQLLEAKERALDAARQQLSEMHEQKRELEVAVAQLEAEVKTVRLAQTRCKVQIDDSRLAEIKSSLAEIRTKLEVEKKTAELQGEFANDVAPVETKVRPTGDVIKQVRSYFTEKEKVAADRE